MRSDRGVRKFKDMPARVLLEICVDSLTGARAAVEAGADRLELCADLVLGGTTPSAGLVRRVRAAVEVPVVVLIRPRAGDFCYGEDEVRVMEEDLRFCQEVGVEGVAVGALTREGTYDLEVMERLADGAGSLERVAHRAFDVATDPMERLAELRHLGFTRLLTSGGAARALDGAERLRLLVEAAGSRLSILAGGGVREEDVLELVRRTGVREVHASAGVWSDGPMRHRPDGPAMGSDRMPGEFDRRTTDPRRVAAFRALLD